MKEFIRKLLIRFKIVKPRKLIDALFVSYTLLIIVPVVFLGIVFTLMSSYQFTEQAKKNDSYAVGGVVDTVGSDMAKIHAITYSLINDENVLKLGEYNDHDFEMFNTVQNVKDVLRTSVIETELLKEIYLYYKKSGFSISSNLAKLDNNYIYSQFHMTEAEFENMTYEMNGNFYAYDIISEYGEEARNVLYIKSVDKMYGNGEIYAVFVLSNEYLREQMRTINFEEKSCMLLLSSDGRYLISEGDKGIISAITEKRAESEKIPLAEGEFVPAGVSGEELLVYSRDVPEAKLKCCYVLKGSHYSVKSMYIWVIILAICIFIIVIGIFVAKIYSRRIYRPFNNIIEFFKPRKEEYGKKSELEFLESRFADIMQMESELDKYKGKYSNYYIERIFYNFLKGYIKDCDSMKKSVADFGICFESSCYSAVLFRIDKFDSMPKTIQMHDFQQFVKENIVKLTEEIYPKTFDRIFEFYDSEYIGLVLAFSEGANLYNVFRRVQKEIYKKLEITLSAGISETVLKIDTLPESYCRLTANMQEMKLAGNEFIFEGNPPPVNYGEITEGQEENIVPCIISKDYEKLSLIFNEAFESRRYSYRHIVQFFSGCIVNIIGFISSNFSDEGDAFLNMATYDAIDNFNTIDEICLYLVKLCRSIGDNIEEREKSTNRMNEKIMGYIRENYMKQIDLQSISEHFGYSKGYFSRYFKKITGKNYVEMLNQYRIDMAKKLMNEEDALKLFEIAEQVGFTSYKTFSEAFKKYEGRSPENYKNSIM